MTDPGEPERVSGDASDRNDRAPGRERIDEAQARRDLRAGRAAIRELRSRVRRHDVPKEHVLLEPELAEDAVDDRRGRLCRA